MQGKRRHLGFLRRRVGMDDEEQIGTDEKSSRRFEDLLDPRVFLASPMDRFDSTRISAAQKCIYNSIHQNRHSSLQEGDGVPPLPTEYDEHEDSSSSMDSETQDAMTPRDYQLALFERAKNHNTIVHLPTGTGKTLIAILLIRHCSRDWYSPLRNDKQSVVLVPSVALAVQQTATLRSNLPYRVEAAYTDTAFSAESRLRLSKADVVVATHGALLDLLMHYGDLFHLKKVNLLVFDECHYCSGNHNYSRILNQFYHVLDSEERPRILGLTASPLINVRPNTTDEHLHKSVAELERTMDATLVSVDDSVEVFSNSIEEQVVNYHVLEDAGDLTKPSPEDFALHRVRLREFKQLERVLEDLGPEPTAMYIDILLRELSPNVFDQETTAQFQSALHFLSTLRDFCRRTERTHPCSDKINALESVLADHLQEGQVGVIFSERRTMAMALYCYFRNGLSEVPNASAESARLSGQFADAEEDISFIGQRQAPTPAKISNQFEDAEQDLSALSTITFSNKGSIKNVEMPPHDCILPVHQKLQLRSTILVRDPGQIFNSLSKGRKTVGSMDREDWLHECKPVRQVLSQLRRNELNLLFATSVVEEGVDLQSCSLVVSFDSIKNTKSYVQMKGRARKHGGRFFVFENSDGKGPKLSLPDAQKAEQRFLGLTRTKVIQLNSQSSNPKYLIAANELNAELDAVRQGYFKAAHGIVDFHSAKSLLNRYFMAMPRDILQRSNRELLRSSLPSFLEDSLVLPNHIPAASRTIVLPTEYRTSQRKEKQRVLSLMACVRLYSLGLLNERLLPLTKKDIYNLALNTSYSTWQGLKLPPVVQLPSTNTPAPEAVIFIHVVRFQGTRFEQFEKVLGSDGHSLAIVTFGDPSRVETPDLQLGHPEFGEIHATVGRPEQRSCSFTQKRTLLDCFLTLMNARWSRRSRGILFEVRSPHDHEGVIPPYAVGILSNTMDLDWQMMATIVSEGHRSIQERTNAVRECQTSSLAKPRIWNPLYDPGVAYVSYGPSGETCSTAFPDETFSSFREYFEVRRDFLVPESDPLYEAHRLWSRPNSLQQDPTDSEAPEESSSKDEMSYPTPNIRLAQSACMEASVSNSHISLLSCFLPQVLFVFERHQLCSTFVRHCRIHFPTLGECIGKLPRDQVLEAITAKSAGLKCNYDKLEWLGDAVLKLIQTDSIIRAESLKDLVQFLHEGDLSALRQGLGSNENLLKVCKACGLDSYIWSKALARGHWHPTLLTMTEDDGETFEIGKKVFADVVESILGLVYRYFGYDVAFAVGDELKVTLPRRDVENTSDGRNDIGESHQATVDAAAVVIVEQVTGYRDFHAPERLMEALTHPTANNPIVPSYQRLEWVGDAVLCLAIREWICREFEDSESMNLGSMVSMEAGLVSNETLAFLAVRTGLHNFLDHSDITLPSRIERYIWSVCDEQRGLWTTDPPKAISDIMESILGAIHVDGGFLEGQKAARSVFQPFMQVLVPVVPLRDYIPAFSLEHPKSILQSMFVHRILPKSCKEGDFATLHPDADIWTNQGLVRKSTRNGESEIAYVGYTGIVLLCIDAGSCSSAIACNKVCSLMVHTLRSNTELHEQLLAMGSTGSDSSN